MSRYEPGNDGESASLAEHAQEKVQRGAQQASQKVAEVVRGGAEVRAQQLSGELGAIVQAMRGSGHALHADGRQSAAGAVDGVTRGIEQVSQYLGGTSGERMLHDLEAFGRRRPWGMIGLGVGVGLAASRFVKASSRTRYDESRRPYEVPSAALSSGSLSSGSAASSDEAPRVPALPNAELDGAA
jgi:hypothetical protein